MRDLPEFKYSSNEKAGPFDVTVISAVSLNDSQRADLEVNLARIFSKQVSITEKIDPSLYGGLRIIAGHTVIDNTIKKKLFNLKKRVYEGVYLE